MSNNNQSDQLIDLRGVTRVFSSPAGDVRALDGVSLTLPRGSFVGVVGRSGSGKSTLVNLIAGLDHPTAGHLRVGDVAVETLGESELSLWRGKHVGVVFQFFQLLPTLTIAEILTSAVSWGTAVLLSLPLTFGIEVFIGRLGFLAPLPFVVSTPSMAGWLLLLGLATLIAAWPPVRRATQLSVREVLVAL